MKIHVEVECTPEEARRFLGLPDLAPVHQVYVDQMIAMARDGVSPDMMTAMMNSWAPLGEAGLRAWQKLFEAGGQKPAGG